MAENLKQSKHSVLVLMIFALDFLKAEITKELTDIQTNNQNIVQATYRGSQAIQHKRPVIPLQGPELLKGYHTITDWT